jgi:hypothetical protein
VGAPPPWYLSIGSGRPRHWRHRRGRRQPGHLSPLLLLLFVLARQMRRPLLLAGRTLRISLWLASFRRSHHALSELEPRDGQEETPEGKRAIRVGMPSQKEHSRQYQQDEGA